jgi:hypothetical protein
MNVSGENNFDQTSVNQVERIHKVTPEEFKRKIVSSTSYHYWKNS